MTMLVIDSMEKLDVSIFDVPGVYLQAEIPEETQVIEEMRGEFIEIICNFNQE